MTTIWKVTDLYDDTSFYYFSEIEAKAKAFDLIQELGCEEIILETVDVH